MKQCDLTKGIVVFLTIMITLFCGVMPGSWAGSDCCEDLNLEGRYGFMHDGMMMMRSLDADGNPAVDADGNPVFTGGPVPMASVGVFCLDRKGKLSGDEVVNFGGTSFPAKIRGRYKVNGDCTGTAFICATPTIPEGNTMGIRSEISFVITCDEIQMLTTKMTHCVDNTDTGFDAATPLNIVGTAKKQTIDDD